MSAELKRETGALEGTRFDLAVIGAGINGAWVALDAARRGLNVALVDQGDFGNATSANSQRIVHGGLRYLQHGDVKRVRESIRERRNLFRIAPFMMRPMPCLVPTYGHGVRSRLALGMALRVNDLLGCDRNRGLAPSRRFPRGRLMSRRECLQAFDGFDTAGLTGGAVFYDGQVLHSERLCLSVLRSASAAGARIANYVRVLGFVREGAAVVGFRAQDLLDGRPLEVRARLVVVCTGPWTAHTLALDADGPAAAGELAEFPVFKAVVLVTRPFVKEMAVALAGRSEYVDQAELMPKGYRNYFVTPWRGRSLLGTFYRPFTDHPDNFTVSAGEIAAFLEEFRSVCPSVRLDRQDVTHVFAGLLPQDDDTPDGQPSYAKHYTIVDREPGRLTVVGVKWTTARDVAEKVVDRAVKRIGGSWRRSDTAWTPLHGGDLGDPDVFLEREMASKPDWLGPAGLAHLVADYGAAYREVLALCEDEPHLREPLVAGRPEIGAEIVHAIRSEMARTLEDVVLRRTSVCATGWPGRACVDACAGLASSELGWDRPETERQVERVRATFERLGVSP